MYGDIMNKLTEKDWENIFDILCFFPGYKSRNKLLSIIATLYYLLGIGFALSGFYYIGIIIIVLPGVVSFGLEWIVNKNPSSKYIAIILSIVLIFSLINTRKYNIDQLLTDIKSPNDVIEIIKEFLGFDATYQLALVSNVVDGDTIDVELMGKTKRVRMILVDTPETKHPRIGKEFYGPEASKFITELLLGKYIYLEKDTSDTDRYDRYLRYIWLDKPMTPYPTDNELKTLNVSGILISNGYGKVVTFPPDTKYKEQFELFERQAKSKKLGMWQQTN